MSILRTGSNVQFSANWETIFGAKRTPKKQATAQARKKTAKKKRTPKKRSAKKTHR